MTTFAYCRVSTMDQDTTMQETAIRAAYPDCIMRTETGSGTTTKDRPVLALIMEMMGAGDRIVVWKLDRLARNMNDLTNLVAELEGKGAALEILDQKIDTGTASGKAFLQMLGVFAEFETNLRRERQMAGVAIAVAEGRYKGRQPVAEDKVAKAMALIEGGASRAKAAAEAGISQSSLYRRLKAG